VGEGRRLRGAEPWHKCVRNGKVVQGLPETCAACVAYPWPWRIDGEEWRAIPGLPAYLVSSLGRIKHVDPKRPPVKPLTSSKYHCFSVSVDSYRKTTLAIHVCVAAAFIGPRPDGMVINHKDGNRANNRLENLEYVTQLENVHHSCRAGRHNAKGRKIDEATAALIFKSTGKYKDIGARFGVSESLVSCVKRGATWGFVTRHMTGPGDSRKESE